MEKELTIKIGGEAGQGIATIGDILPKVLARGGWNVFTSQDYENRIRGGHNIFQCRISQDPIWAMADHTDFLIALDKETIDLHLPELHDKSIIVYDGEKIEAPAGGTTAKFIGIPMDRIAKENGDAILVNVVAVAATLGLLGYGVKPMEEYLQAVFHKKGEQIVRENVQAAQKGYEEALRTSQKGGDSCPFKVQPLSATARMLVNGNEGLALGAMAAGCKFYAGYPMTPSTDLLIYMASKADQFGIVVEQAEDEIAAINMAIGASFAGVRAMTATSGGGFDLMTEGLSLAGMTETPLVIVLGQRPGPATGLATRTEQAELLYAIHAAHGEFPRLVLAPGTPQQAFYLMTHAFNQAERYQIPVIILTDQYLADSSFSFDRQAFSPKRITINRYLLSEEELNRLEGEYKRHAFTETGISPRAFPGQSSKLVMTDSDEHDEIGHMAEDKETRSQEVEKRMRKWKMLEQSTLSPPICGQAKARTLLLCWGSTWGIVHEAMRKLQDRGKSVAMLHFTQLWPFPIKMVMNLLK